MGSGTSTPLPATKCRHSRLFLFSSWGSGVIGQRKKPPVVRRGLSTAKESSTASMWISSCHVLQIHVRIESHDTPFASAYGKQQEPPMPLLVIPTRHADALTNLRPRRPRLLLLAWDAAHVQKPGTPLCSYPDANRLSRAQQSHRTQWCRRPPPQHKQILAICRQSKQPSRCSPQRLKQYTCVKRSNHRASTLDSCTVEASSACQRARHPIQHDEMTKTDKTVMRPR